MAVVRKQRGGVFWRGGEIYTSTNQEIAATHTHMLRTRTRTHCAHAHKHAYAHAAHTHTHTRMHMLRTRSHAHAHAHATHHHPLHPPAHQDRGVGAELVRRQAVCFQQELDGLGLCMCVAGRRGMGRAVVSGWGHREAGGEDALGRAQVSLRRGWVGSAGTRGGCADEGSQGAPFGPAASLPEGGGARGV